MKNENEIYFKKKITFYCRNLFDINILSCNLCNPRVNNYYLIKWKKINVKLQLTVQFYLHRILCVVATLFSDYGKEKKYKNTNTHERFLH